MRFFLFPAIAASVAELSGDDFGNFIGVNKRSLISFVAPWCGHCKELIPILSEVETELKSIGVATGKVDATEESELARKYNVDSYPTIVYISDNIPVKYKGKRDLKSIVSWVQDREVPATIDGSAEEAKTASKGGIAFFARIPENNVADLSAYRTAAKTYQGHGRHFYISLGAPLSVEVYRDGELFNSISTNIAQWIDREHLPLFGEVDADTYELYEASANRGIHFLWVCFEPSKLQEEKKAHKDVIEGLAKAYRNNFNFVWVDSAKFGEDMLDQIGCSSTEFPGFVVHKNEDESSLKRYRFIGGDNHFDEAKLRSFLDGVVAGTQPLFFRSKGDYKLLRGYVKEVNSDSVSVSLVEPKVDQLLLVTISDVSMCPECGPALDTAHVLKAWVEVEKPDTLEVTWIDGMENDPPTDKLHWDNVPYLLFVPAGSRDSFKYTGLRHTPELVSAWLKSVTNTDVIQALDNSIDAFDKLPSKIADAKVADKIRVALETLRDDEEFSDDETPHGEEL